MNQRNPYTRHFSDDRLRVSQPVQVTYFAMTDSQLIENLEKVRAHRDKSTNPIHISCHNHGAKLIETLLHQRWEQSQKQVKQ